MSRNHERLYAIFLAFVIFFSLLSASCRREKRYHIGVSQCSYDDWRLKLNDELERQMLIYPDFELDIVSAYDNPERQVGDIRKFIEEGVDVIITSPVDSENLNAVLAEAREAGIKVIMFDRQSSEPVYDLFLSADNAKLGRAAAEYLVEKVGKNARFIEIRGADSSSPTQGRSRGFRQILGENPEAVCLASAPADWNDRRAEFVTDSLLRLYPETQAIFAHNDRMAIGARRAARRHGREDIRIAGVDAVPSIGMEAVAKGEIDATFIYPTAGAELINLAVKAARGEELQDKVLISSAAPVDRTNASIMLDLNRSVLHEQEKIEYLKDRVDFFRTRQNEQNFTIVAIIMVVILLAVIIFVILKAYWSRRRSQEMLYQQNLQLKKQRDELAELNLKLKEATTAKLTFFTNVSHDLRTPLTLIAEPLHQLREAPGLTPDQRVLASLAEKNVRILMRLINQILDFRKYENDRLILRPLETDIRQCFTEWGESFIPLARKRHIRLSLEIGDLPAPTMAIDPEKLERVYFNLMSNAFKFTPANGSVTSRVGIDDGCLVFEVADTGSGMDEETVSHVFERFYQADSVQPQGSGIGLAVAKAFVELHGGSITVESEPGKGSLFRVVIPVTHVDEVASVVSRIDSSEIIGELAEVSNPDISEIDESKPCVLVIDDTSDIRALLRTLLKDQYTVIEASSGKQGIKLASKYIPDLIICDVMMPGLDGMQTTRRLKEETSTSHIPVMMLTACSLDQQRAEGYESGADGYLSKPFDSQVLLARCKALIANRRRLLAAKDALDSPFAGVKSGGAPSEDSASSGSVASAPRNVASEKVRKTVKSLDVAVENEFYQRFMEIVDKELGNSDISVEEIGSRLGLSRVQFYRKIKALTNYSPNEILRIRRLKTAHTLLTSTESTVAEVAYKVGFSSPSYFSKCFREYFGELPADLQKRTSKIM